MNLDNPSLNFTKRRGLSSIVGALIFVVLMVAAFAVLGVAMDTQTDIVDVNRDVADTGLKKQQENFVINSIVQNNDDFLEVHVTNKAQNPTEIFTMVITNSSDSVDGFPTTTYDVPYDASFLPPFADQPTNILEGSNLKMDITADGIDEKYDIKLISSLGNVQTFSIICNDFSCGLSPSDPGVGGLNIQLLLDGATGVNTKITTVLMFVTNTGDATVPNVSPVKGCADILSGVSPGPGDFTACQMESPDPVDLQPGQTALFKWDGTVTGSIDDVFTFCNTADGDTVSPPIEECDTLTMIDPNDCGGCEGGGDGGSTIILIDDLLIRPSLFLIIPSPFGIPNQPQTSQIQYSGVWGVNVVNPTETPMTISKLTIAAYPPGSTPGAIPFKEGIDACEIEDISPGDTFNELSGNANEGRYSGNWDCPLINVIMWENQTHPITIDPRSNKEFTARVKPGSVAGGDNLDAVIVQANVFTSSGSFGKVGYQTTMYDPTSGPIANVYLSDTNDSRNDIYSQRLNIFSNSTETFKVVFADMDNDDGTSIASGARLIVNVPREWKDVVVTNSTGFSGTSVVEHGDSSTQIIATADSPIGGPDDPDAKTITFTTEAPDVTEEGLKRLYIMYVLADGVTEATPARSVGPLNEIVLQVLPTVS
jgi:hypothetical protein